MTFSLDTADDCHERFKAIAGKMLDEFAAKHPNLLPLIAGIAGNPTRRVSNQCFVRHDATSIVPLVTKEDRMFAGLLTSVLDSISDYYASAPVTQQFYHVPPIHPTLCYFENDKVSVRFLALDEITATEGRPFMMAATIE